MVRNAKKYTVLIIDDDEINRQMADTILTRKLPYEILLAQSGMQGVEMLHQHDVNLILLDVTMPVWDGFKTLSVIRKDEKLRHIPVILLTASADRTTVVKASEHGVVDYIKKPFLPDDLVSRVAKAIWENWEQSGIEALQQDIASLLKDVGIRDRRNDVY